MKREFLNGIRSNKSFTDERNNLKTLNQNHIKELLSKGNILQHEEREFKYYILDSEYNKIGVVRFDTFLKLVKHGIIKKYKTDINYNSYYKEV